MGRRCTTNSVLASFAVSKIRKHLGCNSQNIFKGVLNITKNIYIILGRQWFTTCRFYLLDSVGTRLAVSNDVRTTSERRIERRQRVSKPKPLDSFAFMFLSLFFHFLLFPFIILLFPFIILSFPLISFHCPFISFHSHFISSHFLSLSFHFLSFLFYFLSFLFILKFLAGYSQ